MYFMSLLSAATALTIYSPCYLDKCRCNSLTDVTGMKCENLTSEDLPNVPFANVSSVYITGSNFEDPSALQYIRLKSRVDKQINISISLTTLKHFSWNWMPATIGRMTLSHTGINDIYSKKIVHANGSEEYQCGMDHLENVRGFYIYGNNTLKSVPRCLPPTLTKLILRGVDLSELGNEETHGVNNVIKWPESLKILKLADNKIKRLSKRVFMDTPGSLTRILMQDQPISDSTIFMELPAKTIQHLTLSNTSIRSVEEEHFQNFRIFNILKSISINYGKLESVPKGMPSSLRKIVLRHNKIKFLDISAFEHLANLEHLDMERNLLQTVPEKLPSTLTELRFNNNEITTCHVQAFSKMRNLTTLVLAHNRLSSMPQNIPSTSIRHYSINGNDINDIGPESGYDFCSNCNMFDIANNPWACNTNMMKFLVWTNKNGNRTKIHIAPEKLKCDSGIPGLNDMLLEGIMHFIQLYKGLGCTFDVSTLNCTKNGMTEIPRMSSVIQHIHIVENPIKTVPDFKFASIGSLTILELRNLGLTRIPKGLPSTILELSLAYNNMTHISEEDAHALKNLTKVITIDLRHNKLTTMPLLCTRPLKYLKLVILQGNPLHCDCDLWPFTHWATKTRTINSEKDRYKKNGIRGTCNTPLSLNGRDITELNEYFTKEEVCLPKNCFWDTKTPTINCSYATQREVTGTAVVRHEIPNVPRSGYWRTIDLSGLKLKTSNVMMPELYELTCLILSNNSLNNVPLNGLPKTLKILIVNNNNISSLPRLEELTDIFGKLESLDVRFNNLRTLKDDDLRLFRQLKSLKIHGNPFACDCKQRQLIEWISTTHDNPAMKGHQLETLKCYGPKPLAGKLIAELEDAEYCPTINIGAVVGGTVGGMVLVIFIVVSVIVYWNRKYKIREREAILRGFRELLQQEAGFNVTDPETGVGDYSRFRYDAFLSYSPHEEDEEFAGMLLDNLEITHGYKLCVHERDFMPGVGIADNIVECIGASKRIILVLSHNFVSSPWCQYEVQVALTELHQKRKSKLLIPILLEDLDGQVEGSVKTFLSLIKGIKIPSNDSQSDWEKFWNEILKAMPDPITADEAV